MTTAKNVKLATLVDRGVRDLVYTYDMGGDWRHTITVETVGPGESGVKYPRFFDGERRCPPEDVCGLSGFEMFLDAMADLDHEKHDRPREWYGGLYNTDDIDERFTRLAVAAIAIRRHAGKLAYQKVALNNEAASRPRLLFNSEHICMRSSITGCSMVFDRWVSRGKSTEYPRGAFGEMSHGKSTAPYRYPMSILKLHRA